jgi:hypothetical protein
MLKKANNGANNVPATTVAPSLSDMNTGLTEMFLRGADTVHGKSYEEMFQMFETASDEQFDNVTGAEYLKWEDVEPGTYTFMCTGIKNTVIDNKSMDVAVLVDKELQEYITGASMVVNALRNVKQLPTMCKIIHTGKKKQNKNGNYYIINVLLPKAAEFGF